MKIVVICGKITSAEQRLPYERLKFLCENYSTIIITRGEVCEKIGELAESVIHIPKYLLPKPILFVFWTLAELKKVNLAEIDFIYTPRDSLSIITGYLNQLFLNLTWVVDLWEDLEIDVSRSKRSGYLPWVVHLALFKLTKWTLNRADLIILSFSRDLLTKKYQMVPKKVLSLPHAINVSEFSRFQSSASHKAKPFLIAYAGTVDYDIRDLATVIEAAHKLKVNYEISDFTFRIIGPISSSEALDKLLTKIDELDISNQVSIVGEKSHVEVLEELNRADVCINPLAPNLGSNQYAYTIKISEYMGLGKPIVASDLPGMREMIEDEETGLLVPPGKPEAWAKAIWELYRDHQLRSKLAKNALKQSQQFHHEVIYSQLSSKLKSLK